VTTTHKQWQRWEDQLDARQRDAAARWLQFVGCGPTAVSLIQRGLPWFVDSLAAMEPVALALRHRSTLPDGATYHIDGENVFVARKLLTMQSPQRIGDAWLDGQMHAVCQVDEQQRTITASAVLVGRRGTHEQITQTWIEALPLTQTERALVMQQAISSVLVCLRRRFALVESISDEGLGRSLHDIAAQRYSPVADLLIERGHEWLGEPLAIWLRGEPGDHDLAVRLLIESVPVLPEFAEWIRVDAESLRYSVTVDGVEQTVFAGHNSTTSEIAQALNAQLAGFTAQVDGDTIVLTHDEPVAFSAVVDRAAQALSETRVEQEPRPSTRNASTSWQERAGGRRNRVRSRRR
jgi:hypothetical protein